MSRVLILSHHFYPASAVGARRVSELACLLRDQGWEVTAIAAQQDLVPSLAARIAGIRLINVPLPRKLYPTLTGWLRRHARRRPSISHRAKYAEIAATPVPAGKGASARWLRYYHSLEWLLDDRKLWSWRVLWRALRLGGRWDWIISSGPPVSVHMAARVVAGLTRAPWVMDLRDPWVDNGVWGAHVCSALRDRLEQRLERNCLRRATRITVASPGIGNGLAARVPEVRHKLEVVLNGYDGVARAAAIPERRLRLLYAGSLYLNRDPFPLLEAFRELAGTPGVDRSRIGFTLAGNCQRWNGRDLGAWIAAHGLEDCVHLRPPVSPPQVAAMIEASEVLVNFAQGQPDQIPAKLYEHMAAGRETLILAEAHSDTARITRESGAGRIVEPHDAAALRTALRDLYTFYVERGLAFTPNCHAIGNYSRDYQNGRFMDLLAVSSARG